MYINLILIFLVNLLFSSIVIGQNNNSFSACTLPPETINGMKLIWADEFNTEGIPNPSDWKFEKGFARNKELQWYQNENAYCKDGLLIIEARRERKANPNYDSLSTSWKKNRPYIEYSSSSIKTDGLRSWKYGRFEIRARIDTNLGLWPAIWTLGDSGEWPQNGEIDLMEFYRINNKPHILANVAWGTTKRWTAKWDSETIPLSDITGNDASWPKKFHIWRMDWNSDSICLYIDNRLLNTTLTKETINPDGSNPFHQPHYLLLNLAIGGHGGDPSQTKFPVRYEIDYVRVYQKK